MLCHPDRAEALITAGYAGAKVTPRRAHHADDGTTTTIELLHKGERLDLVVTWPADWPT